MPSLPERAGRGTDAPRPRAFAPLFVATARTAPEDFVVDELFDDRWALDGAGEHLWLRVRKRLLNTADVVAALAARFGVRERDVGHAGLKDRRAVTTQWFSVPVRDDAIDPSALEGELGEGAWRVLESGRHGRKLRRGAHAGNRFALTLTEVAWADADASDRTLAERVAEVRAGGFPNGFGPQRFGHGGRNVERARAMFAEARRGDHRDGGGRAGGRGRRRTATARGLLLSAARARIFNAVLDERVRRGDWRVALDGEPLCLAGSAAFFVPDDGAECRAADVDRSIAARLAGGDLSPSGPMHGTGPTPARGACAALEAALLGADPVLAELAAGLEAAGLDAGRRALVGRAPALEAAVDAPDAPAAAGTGVLSLRFALGRGAYATSLVEALGTLRPVPHSAP